ncbi:MAG: polymer-forming cytoskeletal protein [Spirochaetaceae bacterium]|nr:polymer-forming cytoskeletal protein [Spirochaetaceae bacterium]
MAAKNFGLNTMIGPGTVMEGNFSFVGFTRIDGHLHGDVDVKGQVVIGESARLVSNMTGESITVGGVVRGDVLASESLVILSTGIVIGDCVTGKIKVDEGCVIHGRITICRDKEKWDEIVGEHKDRRVVNRGSDR